MDSQTELTQVKARLIDHVLAGLEALPHERLAAVKMLSEHAEQAARRFLRGEIGPSAAIGLVREATNRQPRR